MPSGCLQMRDESLLAVADHGTNPRGTIVIGANEATCLYVLPDVFAKYCSLYPGVQISIYRNFSYKILEKLENGTHRRRHRDASRKIGEREDAPHLPRSAHVDGEPAKCAGQA